MQHSVLVDNNLTNIIKDYVSSTDLSKYNIGYFSFGFNDFITGMSFSFATNDDWFNFIKYDVELGQLYMKHDHIWKNCFKFHNFCIKNDVIYQERTFLYNSFDYGTKLLSEFKNKRIKFEIERGVMYLEHELKRTFASSFNTNYKNFEELDFAIKRRDLIKHVHNNLKKIVKDFFNISFLPIKQEQKTQPGRLLYMDQYR